MDRKAVVKWRFRKLLMRATLWPRDNPTGSNQTPDIRQPSEPLCRGPDVAHRDDQENAEEDRAPFLLPPLASLLTVPKPPGRWSCDGKQNHYCQQASAKNLESRGHLRSTIDRKRTRLNSSHVG